MDGPEGGTDGRTDRNLPILQEFVPYWGRYPASPMKTKEKVEQGKGTADHLMPLGCLFSPFVSQDSGVRSFKVTMSHGLLVGPFVGLTENAIIGFLNLHDK